MIAQRTRFAEKLNVARVNDVVAAGNEDADHELKPSSSPVRANGVNLSFEPPPACSRIWEIVVPRMDHGPAAKFQRKFQVARRRLLVGVRLSWHMPCIARVASFPH